MKKSMVPVSHQECVPVIKDGWGKTVLKVGSYIAIIIIIIIIMYSQCNVCDHT